MRHDGVFAVTGLIGCVLALWVLPPIVDAGSPWQKAKPVRGYNMAVDRLEPGSTPKGVRPPSDPPPRRSRNAESDPPSGAPGMLDRDSSKSVAENDDAAATVVDAGMDFNLLGAIGRRVGGQSEDRELHLRTSLDGETWSDWVALSLEPAPGDVSAHLLVSDPCWVGKARYVQFLAEGRAEDLELSFVNSLGETTIADRASTIVRSVATAVSGFWQPRAASAVASKPTIVARAKWGANESLRRADPDYAPVKMAFVHHTAGGNSYSRSQAPAVVRAIQHYHVKGAGFNDLGYNFLIDRYGTIYEGRYGGITEGVIGAHTLGFNTNSTGVALMGTFTSAQPTAAALTSLRNVLAWKLDVHHVNPTSSARMTCRASEKYKSGQVVSFAAVSGHRSANYTACPGNALHGKLPSVRTAVAKRGLPKVYAPAVSRALFSPDGDADADTTTFSFSASETVSWRLEISDDGGGLMRRFTGSGRTISKTWDGKDASGVTVPDGTYAAKVTASSARGSARAAHLAVAVDTEPPRIESVSIDPPVIERGDDSRRQPTRIRYTVSEEVRTRVTIRSAGGSRLRTVSDWRWIPAGSRSLNWNGTIEFVGAIIPAPDGPYTILVEARDRAGARVVHRTTVTCESDAARWSDGATFCTKATRSFTIRRGEKAAFRFKILHAPSVDDVVPFATAKVTLKIRDANGSSRLTRQFTRGLNAQRSYTIQRCWLARGSYRYYVYASLPDGRKQQLVGSAQFRIR